MECGIVERLHTDVESPMAENPTDTCATPELIPLQQALARMQVALTPIQGSETLPLAQALDRVLAQHLEAHIDIPGCDNSAMDGYALRAQDCPGTLQVIGRALAGHPFNGPLPAGQALRIMTGASLPDGADTVVMQEQVERIGDVIHVRRQPTIGEHIRRRGEDTRQGQRLLDAGLRLNPLHIGYLASAGTTQVALVRRVKVALFSTGDELISHPQHYRPGAVFDSNRPMLCALLQRLNVEVLDLGCIADQPEALRTAFTQAMAWADVVISSGGVSVGEADYTRDLLAELGQIDLWRVAIKPGKPFAYGRLGQALFFGLPGNPVSAAVTYHQLVLPILRQLAGELPEAPLVLQATAAQAFKKQPGRLDFQRGQVQQINGENRVSSSGLQSSGALRSLANANCFVRLEQARGPVAEGEKLDILPLDKFIV